MINLLAKSKYPIFVLEGPDGAGKTSLAKTLQEYIGGKYIHLTYRFPDKMNLYHSAAIRLAARLSFNQPVIVDRWWPSEIVYADVYRGGSKFTKHYFLLEYIAAKLGVTYVMCLPEDRERYIHHYEELKGRRIEMYDSDMARVYDGYVSIYKHYLAYRENVCHYDMFQNYQENDNSREIILRHICQSTLEFAEDHRSDL